MKTKTVVLAALALALYGLCPATLSAQPVFSYNLGSSGFTIDPFSTTANFLQSSTTLRLSPSVGLGDSVGGYFSAAPYDWTSLLSGGAPFPITLSITGPNPLVPLSVQLYDSTLQVLSSYSGSTEGVTSTPSVVLLPLSSPGTGDFSDVIGFFLTFDSSATIDVTVHPTVIPEPSTYALLMMAAAGSLLCVRRRR